MSGSDRKPKVFSDLLPPHLLAPVALRAMRQYEASGLIMDGDVLAPTIISEMEFRAITNTPVPAQPSRAATPPRKKAASGFEGVYYKAIARTWYWQVRLDGGRYSRTSFKTPEEAYASKVAFMESFKKS